MAKISPLRCGKLAGAKAVAVSTFLIHMKFGWGALLEKRCVVGDGSVHVLYVILSLDDESRGRVFIDCELGAEIQIFIAEESRVDEYRKIRATGERVGFVDRFVGSRFAVRSEVSREVSAG